MRLCMFHPNDRPMERGWVGRIDGDRVLHLAAQTLQSFFLGGGGAREHAEYRLDEVTLLVPVLHPPAVRVFEAEEEFAFANPAAVVGPGAEVAAREGLTLLPRLAAVVGAEGEIGGFTAYAAWRAPSLAPPKDSDFAAGLGPAVVTPDVPVPGALCVRIDGAERLSAELPPFDWAAARLFAAAGTMLRPGDLLVGPPAGEIAGIAPGVVVELDVTGIGVLGAAVRGL